MSNMKEIWEKIPDYEGLYQASNMGRIRSLDATVEYIRNGNAVKRKRFGKILKPCTNKYGYPMVVLTKPNHRKCHSVHRLVMMAFNGKSDLTVNHKNGIKTDNNLSNLEYMTVSENLYHAHRIGLKKAYSKSKYTKEDINIFKKALEENNFRWYIASEELGIATKNLQYAIKRYDRDYYDKFRPRSKDS